MNTDLIGRKIQRPDNEKIYTIRGTTMYPLYANTQGEGCALFPCFIATDKDNVITIFPIDGCILLKIYN